MFAVLLAASDVAVVGGVVVVGGTLAVVVQQLIQLLTRNANTVMDVTKLVVDAYEHGEKAKAAKFDEFQRRQMPQPAAGAEPFDLNEALSKALADPKEGR